MSERGGINLVSQPSIPPKSSARLRGLTSSAKVVMSRIDFAELEERTLFPVSSESASVEIVDGRSE